MTTNKGPDFQNPPVTEVVCGVQFTGATDRKTPHYGLYWDQIRAEYPNCEEHPPLPRLRLDPQRANETILIPPLPPLRRVFFVKPPGNFLIQLQPQRYLYNWRKLHDSDEYPRFDAPYAGFVQEWKRFGAFTDSVNLDQPVPEIFELTYINHIFAEGASFPRDVWNYLGFYAATPKATTARDATALALQVMWPLPDNLGTLSLDAKHGFRMDNGGEVLMIDFDALSWPHLML